MGALIRCVVFAAPALAGFTASLGLSRLLPHPANTLQAVLWFSAITATMLIVIVAVERVARRLLPLAALLNISLLFPDQAPRRFAVARRVGQPRDLQRQLQELRDRGAKGGEAEYMQNVLELVAALSVHDRRTRGHSERVRIFADMIAEQMDLSAADRARLRWASLLHDIGKLLVPAETLSKASGLDDKEWRVIRRHPEEGARLIEPLRPWLGDWAHAVEHHHERWDGKGYPLGLAGFEISLAGRIVGVADAYEVMTASRPYRRALGVVAARAELVRCSGMQFDPTVVRAFLNISVGRLWRVVGIGTWLAELPLLTQLGRLGVQASTAGVTGTAAVGVGLVAVASTAIPTPPPPSPNSPVVARMVTTTPAPIDPPRGQLPTASPGQPTPPPGPGRSGPTPTASPPAPAANSPIPAPGPDPTAPPAPTAAPTPAPPPTPTPPPATPALTMPGPASIVEGSAYSAGVTITEPGSSAWTATVDYGDGAVATIPVGAGGRLSLQHTYGEACACAVTVTAADGRGRNGRGAASVRVTNGSPPAVRLSRPTVILLGPYGATGTISDADSSLDTFTGTVDYGDGSAKQPLGINGTGFAVRHQYPGLGSYTLVVTVVDDDGGVGTTTVSVSVVL